jgi:thymidylate synthase (FAD)
LSVSLIWITPEAEKHIAFCARVSNPSNQDNENIAGLLSYCMKHGHWSVFEMASMCVEITTSRAISAQILRHKSFSFQEFSQRYAQNTDFISYKARRQDVKNRQNSLDNLPIHIQDWWDDMQHHLNSKAFIIYEQALKKNIAKECARMILPMSTETKLYMSGTIRSWLHYLKLRTDVSTQLEHREIALQVECLIKQQLPIIYKAYIGE